MTEQEPVATGDVVSTLPPLVPDERRAARTRQVCRARLARQARRRARIAAIKANATGAVAPLIVGVFCALYVAAFVATVMRFERLVR